MRMFKKLCIIIFVVFFLLAGGLTVWLLRNPETDDGTYRVQAKRLADEIEETGTYDLSKYDRLTGVFTADDGDLYRSEEYYLIIDAKGTLYRVEYAPEKKNSPVFAVECVLFAIFLLLVFLIIYLWRHIIKPFGRLNNVPQELAKGNLAAPIPEEKSRYFGKFTWSVNLLRERIEDGRKKEISMQKDKKLLLLSLSHDIKTPLSAIKLNAKALAKGLYQDEAKRLEAAESINKRADEIESFVHQITKAASEDFMHFEVRQGEEFLSKIIDLIAARYVPQFSMTGTEFVIGEYRDCILSCDPDRLAECLQNLVENAIKYSDGRRIELRFDQMDGCELITVANTGCTLEAKELPQIFESFHRGANAEKSPGNGLGLFICKRLMALMGGEVYADIEDGCFCITLVVRLA